MIEDPSGFDTNLSEGQFRHWIETRAWPDSINRKYRRFAAMPANFELSINRGAKAT
jgi:hypothetical protein